MRVKNIQMAVVGEVDHPLRRQHGGEPMEAAAVVRRTRGPMEDGWVGQRITCQPRGHDQHRRIELELDLRVSPQRQQVLRAKAIRVIAIHGIEQGDEAHIEAIEDVDRRKRCVASDRVRHEAQPVVPVEVDIAPAAMSAPSFLQGRRIVRDGEPQHRDDVGSSLHRALLRDRRGGDVDSEHDEAVTRHMPHYLVVLLRPIAKARDKDDDGV
mmetsp:Transcript_57027/g.165252  ORF Transcript_57027/g.165252 Transcript_57027/m.165252 type:complete len:211 (+) Transcript_57027:211-843(+)